MHLSVKGAYLPSVSSYLPRINVHKKGTVLTQFSIDR